MNILKRAEDNGFVHQITNIDGEKIFAICNCNVNVCYALRTSSCSTRPICPARPMSPRWRPELRGLRPLRGAYCPAGAVKLGQKLCTKSGPVVYPRQELPDSVKWGPDKWDEDYRDNNRINCYETRHVPLQNGLSRAHVACRAT
jgi:hypothetical protein